MLVLFRNPSAVVNPLSSYLAIATATSFVLLSAFLSLAIDRRDTAGEALRASWSLRGTIAPVDTPAKAAPRQADAPKAPVLG